MDPGRRTAALVVAIAVVLAGCGDGAADRKRGDAPTAPTSTRTDRGTTVPADRVGRGTWTYPPPYRDPATDMVLFPDGWVAPAGWVTLDPNYDNVKHAHPFMWNFDPKRSPDTLDLRARAFDWNPSGCCGDGLFGSYISPPLPTGGGRDQLWDGQYMASLAAWDPSRPDVATFRLVPIVDCATAYGTPHSGNCDLFYDGVSPLGPGSLLEVGAVEDAVLVEFALDESFTAMMWSTALDPNAPEGFGGMAASTMLAQGPAFSAMLRSLYDDYERCFARPFRNGKDVTTIAANLAAAANLERCPFVPFTNGMFEDTTPLLVGWSREGLPPLSYRYDGGIVPFDYQWGDDGNPVMAPDGEPVRRVLPFVEWFGRHSGTMHLVEGRAGWLSQWESIGG